MEQTQIQMPATASGDTGWKELFWYMFKIILVVAIIIFGMKYFYEKNKSDKLKKQQGLEDDVEEPDETEE